MSGGLVTPLIGIAAILYTLSASFHLALIARREFAGLARWSTRLAWLLHTLAFALLIIEQRHFPIYTLFEVSQLLVWLLMTPYICMEAIRREQAAGSFLTPVVAGVIVLSLLLPRSGLKPFLSDYPLALIIWHVGVTVLAYTSCFASSLFGSLYLFQERNLRRKRWGPLYYTLPSLEVLDNWSVRFAAAGFPMLTLGVAGGIALANRSWASLWHLDPKVLFTLLVWLVYAGYLLRRRGGWGGRKAAWWVVLGGGALLVNYYLINLASQLHRYGV